VKLAPTPVRRLVVAPVVVAVELLLVVLSPLVLVLALLASPLAGGWRPLRAAVIVVDGAARHLVAIVACLVLWVAAGFGRRLGDERVQERHYALMRWFVSGIYATIVSVARVRVEAVDSDAAGAVLGRHDRPVLLLARHAGEGDTLLVIYELLCPHRRRPRIVMHERLRLDPFVDALGGRLPNRFVDPAGGDTERDIADLASTLEPHAALVIFPEGRNFSARHRVRAIDRLARAGHEPQAEAARRMRRVSAPRPGGTLAAIAAAPGADVVIMGHAGFPDGLRDVWRHLPEDQVIEVRLWHEPAEAIPAGSDAQIDWLFGWWQRIDDWVVERETRDGRTTAASRK
jgi:1-acyl-sn-glycerol-3-phosphate acyltransferase